jgi:hypothetical protein
MTLQHFTDTDPNRIQESSQNSNGVNATLAASSNPPPNRRRSSAPPGPDLVGFSPISIEGTDGNPLRGQPQEDQQAEAPQVGAAVEVTAAPSMAPKRRGKVQISGEDSGGLTTSMSHGNYDGSGALTTSQSVSMGSPSNSKTLEARRRQQGAANEGGRNGQKPLKKQENNMFASMMLGGGFNKQDQSDEYSPSHYDDRHETRSVRRGSGESRALTNVPGGGGNGIGDVIGALPQDDGPAMLIPATMEAPEQIFMPNMKREPYVPVRLARDKIKQALSEIASHNSKHYAAIETMEKQYEILKAQMEHQVATYAKKLTMHYNQRVADLNNQLKERLSSGAKGQAFAQLMADVDTWKNRATDAESELELMKKELEKVKAERDEALDRAIRAERGGGSNKARSIDDDV